MGSVHTNDRQRTQDVERIAGRYRIEARLAQGGMGTVYRAFDERTGKRIALKRLLASSQKDQNSILFAREYHTLVSLKHPRVIEVYDFGVDTLGPYYTMELLEGRDLRELSPLDYRNACRHLRDVASSLALLHARRLLHRDISARNVRVTADGRCKLIDFGALTNFGVSGDLVGTPPNIAPEAVRGDPLDQRADLYSLGTLAYALLSGRQAYPARRLEDLIDAWKVPPTPISKLVEGIPPNLEQLIGSLLSRDPLARPVSAAEVIERLNNIAELEPDDDLAVAEGYLVSPEFVGREPELRQLHKALSQATEGRGAAVLLESSLGLGKTRLLGELALHAQTVGAAVLQVDAEMHQRSFGLLEALGLRLLDLLPEQALSLAQRHAGILAHLSPTMRRRLGVDASSAVPQTPGEWRGRAQAAMQSWLLSVAALRPVLLAIDNLHAADPASAAVIGALAREARQHCVLLACTTRTGERVAAPDAMRLFREHSSRHRLTPLQPSDVQTLVRSLFGEAPNAPRLAKWIYDSTSGNPLHAVELARHLANTGAARYIDGAWTLPDDLSSLAPAGLGSLAAARLAHLSEDARDFASALSVQHGPLSLELCVKLWGEQSHERVFRTFDELVGEGILRSEGGFYAFAQQAVREKVLETLDPERRSKLHRTIAALLLASEPDDPRVSIEAGWHLLRAGDETRGAELLSRVGARTHAVGAINNDFHAAVPALEAALRVYRNQQRSAYEIVPLLTSLTRAAYYVDRRLATEYGEEALELLPRLTGIALARRLSPWVGGRLALFAGVVVAFIRFKLSRTRDYQFRELFVYLFSCVTTLCGVATICLDPDKVQKYAQVIEPMRALGPGKTPAGIYEYCMLLKQIGMDRWGETRAGFLKLAEQFADPNSFRSLPEESRKLYQGGIYYALGVVEALRDGPAALQWADRLEKLDLKLYEMVAHHVRVLYHVGRGELDRAREFRERLDVHAVQAGSAWQVEIWAPATTILPYLTTLDVIGLKRTNDQLTRLAKEIPSLLRYSKLAHSAYLLARGDWAAALAENKDILRDEAPRAHAGWAGIVGAIASTHNSLGNYAEAKRICEDALGHLTEADRPFAVMNLKLYTELALARAGLGELQEAANSLDALLEEHRSGQGPLTLGSIHSARARVAILQKDPIAFAEHVEQMGRWFRPTKNPALIAQCEKLEKLASSSGLEWGLSRASAFELNSFENIARSLIIGSHSPEDRAARAIELIVRETRGSRGFLYEKTQTGLRLVASVADTAPPEDLERTLLRKVADMSEGLSTQEVLPTLERADNDPLENVVSQQLGLVLCTQIEDKLLVYGAVAIEGPNLLSPSHPFLQSITRGMLGLASLKEAELAGHLCTTDKASPVDQKPN